MSLSLRAQPERTNPQHGRRFEGVPPGVAIVSDIRRTHPIEGELSSRRAFLTSPSKGKRRSRRAVISRARGLDPRPDPRDAEGCSQRARTSGSLDHPSTSSASGFSAGAHPSATELPLDNANAEASWSPTFATKGTKDTKNDRAVCTPSQFFVFFGVNGSGVFRWRA